MGFGVDSAVELHEMPAGSSVSCDFLSREISDINSWEKRACTLQTRAAPDDMTAADPDPRINPVAAELSPISKDLLWLFWWP